MLGDVMAPMKRQPHLAAMQVAGQHQVDIVRLRPFELVGRMRKQHPGRPIKLDFLGRILKNQPPACTTATRSRRESAARRSQ